MKIDIFRQMYASCRVNFGTKYNIRRPADEANQKKDPRRASGGKSLGGGELYQIRWVRMPRLSWMTWRGQTMAHAPQERHLSEKMKALATPDAAARVADMVEGE